MGVTMNSEENHRRVQPCCGYTRLHSSLYPRHHVCRSVLAVARWFTSSRTAARYPGAPGLRSTRDP